MKTLAALLILAAAAIPASADPAPGRTTRTEIAMGCMLGMAQSGCGSMFEGATIDRGLNVPSVRPLSWNDAHNLYDRCMYLQLRKGLTCIEPLETVQYVGANAAGNDVYEVNYKNRAMTYVIAPPGADGKIPALWIFDAPRSQVVRPDIVTVAAPVTPAAIIYRRPA